MKVRYYSKLSYPLKCGLLQPETSRRNSLRPKLSYPLKCGLLQLLWKSSILFESQVVIPTQMRASTTYVQLDSVVSMPSCHTHSNAGFYNCLGGRHTNFETRCHTHSNAGFYNEDDKTEDNNAKKLSYPLKCGLLQHFHLERLGRIASGFFQNSFRSFSKDYP